MLRFKHFVGSGPALDHTINAWLAEYEPEVTQMAQTVQGDSVIVSFLFDESFRGQELRFSAEHGVSQGSVPSAPATSLPDDRIIVADEPAPTPTDLP